MATLPRSLKDKLNSLNLVSRFLTIIEKGGNALPHPAALFGIMALLAIVVSGITSLFDLSVIHPGTGEKILPNKAHVFVKSVTRGELGLLGEPAKQGDVDG